MKGTGRGGGWKGSSGIVESVVVISNLERLEVELEGLVLEVDCRCEFVMFLSLFENEGFSRFNDD